MADLQNPIFHDEKAARVWLENHLWPAGPVCPHCGSANATVLRGKAHRDGVYQCNEAKCRQQFTVTVGTLYERSKIPLSKWLMASYLLCASKKGMSTRQLSRMLGVSVKSTWFMMHRIRESMREAKPGPLGGQNKVVEVDETYIGGKARNVHLGAPIPFKEPVIALVERDGKMRSYHLPSVSRNTLRPILFTQIDRKSYLMTDQAPYYKRIGKEYSGHGKVNHSIEEYVRGTFWHTNTVEGYFSILKRGITGTYQWVSQQHLKRYLGEFDFRYNTRQMSDMERTIEAAKGIVGKRLTYRRTNSEQAAQA